MCYTKENYNGGLNVDLLSDILSKLQLKGTLYFRTSFTSPWSVGVPQFENVARFHFALKGRCLIRIEADKPPVFLEQGDLVIITRGAAHTLYCDPKTENPAMMVDEVVQKSGFTGVGALVYGEFGTDHETQLVCGHFAFDPGAHHPLIDALPSHILIKNYGEASGTWLEHTLKVIGAEVGHEHLGSNLIALKLSEIIFAQALRAYLAAEGANTPVLAGFAEPHIARTLTAIHKSPGDAWPLERLSKIAGLSRTAFSNRFLQCTTMTPLEYLTNWRMQIARKQLTTTNEPIVKIAELVGYHPEAAFSRVLKKYHSLAPGTYRSKARSNL